MLTVAYGECTLSKKNVYKWYKLFQEGRENVKKKMLIKTASLKEFKDIPKSAFQKCFEDWKKRWHKCIISEGDYFEGDKINIDE